MSKNRDITTEQWIQSWGVSFDLAEIDLRAIDLKKSLAVQNRSAITLDEEHQLSIMEWLDDPAHVVDPIVVCDVNGRFYIIDGNHRAHAAVEMGRSTIDAYVVTVPQETFEGMVLAANARNAKGISYAERIELGQALAVRFGTAVAAAQVLMKPEVLQREARIKDGRAKVQTALKIDPSALTKSKCEALNRLDVDQIKALGDVVKDATRSEIDSAVQNILAVAAADQHEQAVRESGRLEQVQRDKKRPGSKRPAGNVLTTNKMRTQVIQWTKFLADNPAAFNDSALMDAVADLIATVASRAEVVIEERHDAA